MTGGRGAAPRFVIPSEEARSADFDVIPSEEARSADFDVIPSEEARSADDEGSSCWVEIRTGRSANTISPRGRGDAEACVVETMPRTLGLVGGKPHSTSVVPRAPAVRFELARYASRPGEEIPRRQRSAPPRSG